MKYLLVLSLFIGSLTFTSCEACYECEGYLGLETECCGDKDECDNFKKDCDLNGGRIIDK